VAQAVKPTNTISKGELEVSKGRVEIAATKQITTIADAINQGVTFLQGYVSEGNTGGTIVDANGNVVSTGGQKTYSFNIDGSYKVTSQGVKFYNCENNGVANIDTCLSNADSGNLMRFINGEYKFKDDYDDTIIKVDKFVTTRLAANKSYKIAELMTDLPASYQLTVTPNKTMEMYSISGVNLPSGKPLSLTIDTNKKWHQLLSSIGNGYSTIQAFYDNLPTKVQPVQTYSYIQSEGESEDILFWFEGDKAQPTTVKMHICQADSSATPLQCVANTEIVRDARLK